MAGSPPPPPLLTSALSLGLDAFATVRAAVAAGIADARASFELTLGEAPGDWGFLVLAGIEPLVDALERLKPRVEELDWLGSTGVIDGPTRRRLVESRFTCDVEAVPEGSIVFPGEAVVVVEGPFWQAQLVGGLVQAAVSDSTAVATRFARLRLAAGGADVLEDGAATTHRLGGTPLLARAAYLGGASSTTSALAARRYGIPCAAFEPARFGAAVGDADRAVRAWLAAVSGECVVRVEPTRAAEELSRVAAAVRDRVRASGSGWDGRSVAIELPDGDRIGLARAAAAAFAAERLPAPGAVVTGDVDEHLVLELRDALPLAPRYAARAEGVPGTRHVARYELAAIEEDGAWSPRVRAGLDGARSGDPGRKLLVRYSDSDGRPVADVAHATSERLLRSQGGRYVDRRTGAPARLAAHASAPLRASALRAGKRASQPEPLAALRERAARAVRALPPGLRSLSSPAHYPVGMTPQLAALRAELLAQDLTRS